MGNRDRRDRQKANRRKNQPFRVVVCLGPDRSFENALEPLKASVLYGDEVRLVSPTASLINPLGAIHGLPPRHRRAAIAEFLAAVDEGPQAAGLDPAEAERMRDQIRRAINPRSPGDVRMRRQLGIDPDVVRAQAEHLAEQSATIYADTGFDLISPAIEAGLITVEHVLGGDNEHLGAFFERLRELVELPGAHTLFDESVADLVRAMVSEGLVQANPIQSGRARQVGAAERFIRTLPTFPLAPMDEVLDIRDRLRPPLSSFRSAMVEVSDAIAPLSPWDSDFSEAVVDQWIARVEPALDQLDELSREGGLLGSYTGPAGSAVLTIGAASAVIPSLSGTGPVLAAALTTLAALWSTGQSAVGTRDELRAKRQANPFLFLHLIGEHLS